MRRPAHIVLSRVCRIFVCGMGFTWKFLTYLVPWYAWNINSCGSHQSGSFFFIRVYKQEWNSMEGTKKIAGLISAKARDESKWRTMMTERKDRIAMEN